MTGSIQSLSINQVGDPADNPKLEGATELLFGFSVVLEAKEFESGRKMDILDENGTFVAALQKNVKGNTPEEEHSYSLIMMDGSKVLVPVPYVFPSAAGFTVNIDEKANVEIVLPFEKQKFYYKVSEPDVSTAQNASPKILEQHELTSEWQEFALADDQCLGFYNKQNEIWARVYKVPHKNEYILREASGEFSSRLAEGVLYENSGNVQKSTVDYGVKDGKFLVKGNFECDLKVEQGPAYQKISAGEDAVIIGTFNGGQKIGVASFRELGKVKDGMPFANEDNAGFNADTMVVGDGLGSHYHGALASDFTVECILKRKGDFKKILDSAHEDLVTFVGDYVQLVEEHTYEVENGLAVDDPYKLKKISVPDNVMAAARIEGYKLKVAIVGDAKVYVIREDEIVYESPEQTWVQSQLDLGLMTPHQALASEHRNVVTSTMANYYEPVFQEFDLQPRDRVLVMSDGGIMPPETLVDCVQHQTVENGLHNLMTTKTEENNIPGAYFSPSDKNGDPVRIVSWDNTTFVLTIMD